MIYDVKRWTCADIDKDILGEYVLASDAEAHEAKAVLHEALRWEAEYRELRERTIKDCIAELEKSFDLLNRYAYTKAIFTLRSLLEGKTK